MSNIVPFRPDCVLSTKTQPTAGQPADPYHAMTLARSALIESFSAWLRSARPVRDDAMQEADGTAAILRQLATIESRGW